VVSENFAGNIIVNLANLPDFLRRPILKKRMEEFFTLQEADRVEVISNALAAGPTIPFPNFAKLFGTWLDILADSEEEKREIMFSAYIAQVLKDPQKLILFNLDGILEVFLGLEESKKDTLARSIRSIFSKLADNEKKILELIVPQNAKSHLGI
jgi:hypothetical protein